MPRVARLLMGAITSASNSSRGSRTEGAGEGGGVGDAANVPSFGLIDTLGPPQVSCVRVFENQKDDG